MNAKTRSILIAVGLALNAAGAAILAVANAGCSGSTPATVTFSGAVGTCPDEPPPANQPTH